MLFVFSQKWDKENLSESPREIKLPTIRLRICRTSITHELVHGITHHKVLKGSVLVVKQMQIIFAFGFAGRRLKVV